ncbi:MAG: glycerate kinase [Acidimicrobiia bacterium]|nr:glycerate kinase [Acidimicrobiia bacterium]
MKIVIAVDKFAGTMTSQEAGEAIADGWLSVRKSDEVVVIPMADGGPGTVDALASAGNAVRHTSTAVSQYGEEIEADWLVVDDSLAVIEAASVCGLHLSERRSPLDGDTSGLGILLAAVANFGITDVLIGLGGSGTVDGGVGMARALGANFGINDDSPQGPAPRWLLDMTSTSPIPSIGLERVRLASDVDSPLLGPRGAASLFGPQKGATSSDIEVLEAGLRQIADVVERDLPGGPWRDARGAGAAGGLGFGAMAWLGAEVVGGADLVADEIKLDAHLSDADIVITGEGSADASTLEGKVPVVVLRRATGRPVYLVAGRATDEVGHHFNRYVELGERGLSAPHEEARRAGSSLADSTDS